MTKEPLVSRMNVRQVFPEFSGLGIVERGERAPIHAVLSDHKQSFDQIAARSCRLLLLPLLEESSHVYWMDGRARALISLLLHTVHSV